jgi:hypothetical protein
MLERAKGISTEILSTKAAVSSGDAYNLGNLVNAVGQVSR